MPAMAKRSGSRSSDVVWSSTDGDLRKARDPRTVTRVTTGPVKVRRETAGRNDYAGQAETAHTRMPAQERSHARVLQALLSRSEGAAGNELDDLVRVRHPPSEKLGDERDA